MARLNQAIVLLVTIFATSLIAESHSSTHFGFGIETNRKYKIDQEGGSLVVFDWSTEISETLSLGLKTVASGATGKTTSLQRLTSGPMLSYAWQKMHLQYSLGYFQESVQMGGPNSSELSSKGLSHTISINRFYKWLPQVSFGWGTFLSFRNGKVTKSTPSPNATAFLRSGAGFDSFGNGIFASLRMIL
ncbi:hypothetical protein N9D31_00150 [Oligoflexaceae bacterium]|nr:hypothetical protein [Oligoflexaceae bacterium]